MRALLIAASLLPFCSPVAAQPGTADMGLEERASFYFAAPAAVDARPVVREADLNTIGAIGLARSIGDVEEALAECRRTRYHIETLIQAEDGAYGVHPYWIDQYQNCLVARQSEILILQEAIRTRQTDMLEGQDSNVASRIFDVMARVSVYRVAVRDEIAAEFLAQRDFIQTYNQSDVRITTVSRAEAETLDLPTTIISSSETSPDEQPTP